MSTSCFHVHRFPSELNKNKTNKKKERKKKPQRNILSISICDKSVHDNVFTEFGTAL